MISVPGFAEPADPENAEEVAKAYGAGESLPYGVRVSDSRTYADLSLTGKEYYCGIAVSSKYRENAVYCLEYLMGE